MDEALSFGMSMFDPWISRAKAIGIFTLTDIQTYIQIYILTHMHTCIHTYIHTYIPTYLHTYIPTYIHTYIHTQQVPSGIISGWGNVLTSWIGRPIFQSI